MHTLRDYQSEDVTPESPNVTTFNRGLSPLFPLFGVSNRTLQEWEQGRRTPTGPAMNLLRVYQANPETVTAALA